MLTNLELKYNPLKWFTHRVSTGLDMNAGVNSQLWPRQPEGATHVWAANGLGRRDVTRSDNRLISFDYGTSAKFSPVTSFVLTTSAGFQYYKRMRASITADGRQFAAIPLTSVGAGAVKTSDENFSENSTVGLFIQQQVDWRNRVFLTGAVRGDDNSTFGAEYNAAIYPKLSGTWVINEESFWPLPWVDQFKLRGAWGAAGQQPGTFDASRLYNPEVGYQDLPVLVPGAYGNPQLSPERSEELEYGFDASVLDGRIDFNVTRYRRWITDAIVNRPVPPSSGFTGSQTVNVARVSGWGNELGISADVLTKRAFGWNVGVQIASMGTRIESLGDLGNISAGLRFEHRTGYPVGGVFVKKIRSATIDGIGNVTGAICDGGTGTYGADQGGPDFDCTPPTNAVNAPRVYVGPSTPTWQLGITNSFTLFQNLRIEARIEGNGGHYNINTEMRASHNNGSTLQVLTRDDVMVQATRAIENDVMGLYNASFVKLREVSASYTLPSSWLKGLGVTRGAVTVSARNLMMLWTGHNGFNTPRDGRVPQIDELGDEWTWDPEIRSTGQIAADFQTVLPPTTSVNVTLRLGF